MNNNVVIFGGDVAPTDSSREYLANGDIETLFTNLLPIMKEADNVIVNLETSITDKNLKIRKCGPNIKAPVETAKTLKKAGITACGLANNHVYDLGVTGLRDTFKYLDESGIDRFGAGMNEEESVKPYSFMAGDKKITVIAVGEHEYNFAFGDKPGSAPYEPFDTLFRIRDAKKEADYVVVMYHGGKEQCEYPSPRLYKACHAFVEMGADIVLCQHSHIIGTYEYYKDSFILYGQGNFNFMNYWPFKGWTTGLMLKVTFADKMDIKMIPIDSMEHGMKLAEPDKAEKIMNDLEKRSESLHDGTWIKGWDEFCEEKRADYTKVVDNAFGHGDDPVSQDEYFNSYLTCEAHLDVWQWIFPIWHFTGEDGGLKEE